MKAVAASLIIVILALVALGFVLFMNIYEPLAYLDNPVFGYGLGNLCNGEENCRIFCNDNRGRCIRYCQENPSNGLCNILGIGK